MSAWAKPGVKCVCILNEWQWGNIDTGRKGLQYAPGPKGSIFTIIEVAEYRGEVYLGLYGTPVGEQYMARGFRPLIFPTIEADTEFFLKIAHQAPALNEADA